MPTITISQLEFHLWEAASILRGPVDAADFKTYVFPLLFFKRLSDVTDEEHAAALKAFEGDEEAALFPENYGFQIPESCHWRDVRKVAANVGQVLQTALRGIEQANPHTLYGIFGDAQWTNQDRLPDALLRDLIEHLSRLSFGNAAAELLPEHVERIHSWVRDYTDVEGIARVVTLDEIAANDHNLNIPRYVEPKVVGDVLSVEAAMKGLRKSAEEAFAADDQLVGILKLEGLLSAVGP